MRLGLELGLGLGIGLVLGLEGGGGAHPRGLDAVACLGRVG